VIIFNNIEIEECNQSKHYSMLSGFYSRQTAKSDYIVYLIESQCDACNATFYIPDLFEIKHGFNYEYYKKYIEKYHTYNKLNKYCLKESIYIYPLCKKCKYNFLLKDLHKTIIKNKIYNKLDVIINLNRDLLPYRFNSIDSDEYNNNQLDLLINTYLTKILQRSLKDEKFRKHIRNAKYINGCLKNANFC